MSAAVDALWKMLAALTALGYISVMVIGTPEQKKWMNVVLVVGLIGVWVWSRQ